MCIEQQGCSELARSLRQQNNLTIRFNFFFLNVGTSKKQRLHPSLSHLLIFILVAAVVGNCDKNISLLLFSSQDVVFLDPDY